jgi:NitT/TauT family transport system substrate-binding protein
MMKKLACAALAAVSVAGAVLAAAPARAEVKELRMGLQYGLIYLPIVIAAEEKLIDKRAKELGLPGIEVTLTRFSGSTAMSDAVLSGSIDVGAYGMPGLLIAWDKTRGRQSVRGVASLARTAYAVVTDRPEIKTLKDFGENDRIALPAANSPQAILLKMASEQLYGNTTHFDTMMTGLPHPDATAALLTGSRTISGYVSTPPFQQTLLKDKRIHKVTTSKEILGGEEATGAAVGGTQKFADANPKTTQAVYLAIDDAIRFIHEKTPRAAEIYLASEKSNVPKEEVQEMLLDKTTDYDVAPHGLKKFADFMVKIGMLSQAPKDWKETFFAPTHDRKGD